MKIRFFVTIFIILFLSGNVLAFTYEEPLPDAKQEERAQELFKQIRCLVCISQSVADSETDLAKDLRAIIRKRIQEGESDQQIKDFFVSRYGNQVLLAPPVENSTYLLWFSPFVFLIIGLIIFAASLSAKKKVKKNKK